MSPPWPHAWPPQLSLIFIRPSPYPQADGSAGDSTVCFIFFSWAGLSRSPPSSAPRKRVTSLGVLTRLPDVQPQEGSISVNFTSFPLLSAW